MSPYKDQFWSDKRFAASKLVWEASTLYDWESNDNTTISVNMTESDGPRRLWNSIKGNQTIYLHASIVQKGYPHLPNHPKFSQLHAIIVTTKLTKLERMIYRKPTRKLLSSPSMSVEQQAEAGKYDPNNMPTVTHLINSIVFRMVTDFRLYPLNGVPPLVRSWLRYDRSSNQYLPVAYADSSGQTADIRFPLNDTIKDISFQITFAPTSLSRWQFLAQMEASLELQKGMGVGEKDTDDVKRMITETNPTLLAVTFVVSVFHILFDILAFKNDIEFWRNAKSFKGLSVSNLAMSFVAQLIIFLYLQENDTSLLVLGPAVVGLVIQGWKLMKATGSNIQFVNGYPTLKFNESVSNSKTAEADATAMKYIYTVFYPLIFGFAMYSLIEKEHSGWYSYSVSTLVGFVYAFGFIMMTPQLFINYKLKSVAHMPWKFLIYRSLNTFIDDLFAFIIKMPTMHRLSCFRDDIVFFIFMYQRWIYPVDMTRSSEYEEDELAGGRVVDGGVQDSANDGSSSALTAPDSTGAAPSSPKTEATTDASQSKST
jgi:hypothetical protein